MEVDHGDQGIIERVAALDVGKAGVVCCVRVPGTGLGGRRLEEIRTFTTMTRSLLALGDWLGELGVTRVVMEATSDYWRPPFYLLEDRLGTWLVNAEDVKLELHFQFRVQGPDQRPGSTGQGPGPEHPRRGGGDRR